MPVNLNQNRKKRDLSSNSVYDSETNSHQIKKRDTSTSLKTPHFCGVDDNIKTIQSNEKISRKVSDRKRSLNGQPISMFVEQLVVIDQTIYLDHQKFLNTNDRDVIFESMKIYFSHMFNGVNQQFVNSLANDPDLRIYIKLKNFLFFTVILLFKIKSFKNIN